MSKQKIRALAESINGQNYATAEVTIEKWLAENPIDRRVVGLTPSQVQQLAHRLDTVESEYIEGNGYADVIYEFLAEQTFTDEQVFNNSTAPSWESAPFWATHRAMDSYGKWCWFEKKPTRNLTGWFDNGGAGLPVQVKGWEASLQERPIPKVVVEIGQVWKHVGLANATFTVTEVQRHDVDGLWIECECDNLGFTWHGTLANFTKQFQQVI